MAVLTVSLLPPSAAVFRALERFIQARVGGHERDALTIGVLMSGLAYIWGKVFLADFVPSEGETLQARADGARRASPRVSRGRTLW